MKPEQSSLYRRHTKLFESWEPFFPFLPLCHLHSVFAVSLSFAQHTIIFTAWNPCANNTCQLVCTRARNWCIESRNLAAIRSRRERDVGVIVKLSAGKSAECFRRSETDDWASLSWSSREVYRTELLLTGKIPKGWCHTKIKSTTLEKNRIKLLIIFMSSIFIVQFSC